MKSAEHQQQAAFIKWCRLKAQAVPELRWIHAIPNGGHRDIRVASKLKAEGVTPGIYDIFFPVPRNGYHGLYLEFKAGKNKLTEHQKVFEAHCKEFNYAAHTVYNWLAAAKIVVEYLGFTA